MTKRIKRRDFITGVAAIGAGSLAASSFPTPALSKGVEQWKMVMTWQKVLPGLGTGASRLARRISQLSEGKLEVKVYGGGELVPAMEVFDAVSQGTAQMGHCAPYYWLNKSKATAFFCGVPGGLTAQEQNAWLYFGGGKPLWDKLYGQFGLIAFPAGNTGCQMGGWFNRELHGLEDLKGLKMRIPGLAGEVFTKLGGSAQVIPPQELYTAMQSGVIDALEWVGPWNDLALGFQRVSKYYYGPAFQEGGPTLELMVNKEAFDGLSKDLQKVVKVACAAENDLMNAEFFANNARAFHELKHRFNTDIRLYPEEIMNAFFTTAKDVIADVANEGALEKEIYESYMNFQKQTVEMVPYTELGFLNARHRNQG